jgi:hypothetical protein
LEFVRTEGGLEAAAVFKDVISGVPPGKAQIEDSFVVLTRDTTELGAKAVD